MVEKCCDVCRETRVERDRFYIETINSEVGIQSEHASISPSKLSHSLRTRYAPHDNGKQHKRHTISQFGTERIKRCPGALYTDYMPCSASTQYIFRSAGPREGISIRVHSAVAIMAVIVMVAHQHLVVEAADRSVNTIVASVGCLKT